jgi:hypothetical protein
MVVDRTAKFVSVALSAPVSSAIPCILFLGTASLAPPMMLLSVFSALVLLAIAPISFVWLIAKKQGTDINIPDRTSRLYLFPLAILCQMLAVTVFTQLAIQSIVTFATLCLLVTIAVFLLSLRFKVSIHAAALSGAITAVVSSFGVFALPAYLLLVPVIWSRRSLRVHGIWELLAGAVIGVVLGLFIYHNIILDVNALR